MMCRPASSPVLETAGASSLACSEGTAGAVAPAAGDEARTCRLLQRMVRIRVLRGTALAGESEPNLQVFLLQFELADFLLFKKLDEVFERLQLSSIHISTCSLHALPVCFRHFSIVARLDDH